MKISEITIKDIKDHTRVSHNEEDSLFSIILIACKHYIKSYTGLTFESMDLKEDLTIALLVLATEMYENRTYTVEEDKVNPVVKTLLNLHSINLL
ncbi:head-tail connector protein [Robertmurraya korlensis]|uniref:head-tail connector protein n=1 Tax=Robertmurraya korlensis TaxID=519977 RepID=UPI00203F9B71|nr:head-tail connector protein [Robertmurraya korlensis]MCM3599388.1 head-tail connector protein [Robertmurraya korlensis]